MNRRRFVIVATAVLAVVTGLAGALALISSYGVRAAGAGLPDALRDFPASTDAVMGMNVAKFVASPLYARFEAKHGQKFADKLAEFTARTGVDPKRDLLYLIAATDSDAARGKGVAIAVGQFNQATITDYISQWHTPVRVEHRGTTLLMVEEKDGREIDKGIAFLSGTEIAVGSLEWLKAVIDVRAKVAPGLMANTSLAPLVEKLDPSEMFWFAGNAANILAKAPPGARVSGALGSLENVVGTLNLTDFVTGRITATARDEESARKLADVARGLVALGELASDRDERLAELLKGVRVVQDKNEIRLSINFSIDLLERLEESAPIPRKAVI